MKATNFAAANIFAPIFCLIFASTLFQTGVAAHGGLAGILHSSKPHPPTLPNLEGNEKKFYEMIVAPLAAKCADDKFGSGLGISQKMEKEMLCKNVKKIAKLFTDLNGIYKQAKTHLVGTTQQAIREVVLLEDLQELKEIYSDLLSWEVAKPIEDAILLMTKGHNARDNLKQAFVDTFGEIKQWKIDVTEKLNEKRAKWGEDVTKKINEQRNKIAKDAKKVDQKGKDEADQQEKEWKKLEADLSKAEDRDTVERRQIAFKFLCIGYEMEKLFNRNSQEEQHWTMEQFVANLFVYSLRVDRPNYRGEPEIEGIAAKWPIAGMEDKDNNVHVHHHQSATMV
jgi:hypothetical protein